MTEASPAASGHEDAVERREPGPTRAIIGGLSPDEFKLAFRNHPAGVAIVTADAGQGPAGLTATSVFSVSAEPPILVFSLSAISSATPTIEAADTIVVHLLGADDLPIAKLFATSGIDRFADHSAWDRLPTGEPYLAAAPVRIRARIIDRITAGGSTVIVAHALESHVAEDATATPLVYHNRSWHGIGEHSRLDA